MRCHQASARSAATSASARPARRASATSAAASGPPDLGVGDDLDVRLDRAYQNHPRCARSSVEPVRRHWMRSQRSGRRSREWTSDERASRSRGPRPRALADVLTVRRHTADFGTTWTDREWRREVLGRARSGRELKPELPQIDILDPPRGRLPGRHRGAAASAPMRTTGGPSGWSPTAGFTPEPMECLRGRVLRLRPAGRDGRGPGRRVDGAAPPGRAGVVQLRAADGGGDEEPGRPGAGRPQLAAARRDDRRRPGPGRDRRHRRHRPGARPTAGWTGWPSRAHIDPLVLRPGRAPADRCWTRPAGTAPRSPG